MTESPPPVMYWVDTCSFTRLARDYPRVNFEPVWRLVESLARAGRLLSVEEVKEEIAAQDDEVNEWASENSGIFLPLEDEIQLRAREILAGHPTLIDTRKIKGSADPFLIAAALVHRGIVVTEEKRSGGPHRVKIPDVCSAMGVKCVNLLAMLQAEGLRSR